MRIAQEEIFGPVMSRAEVLLGGGGLPDRQRRRVRARRRRLDRATSRAPTAPSRALRVGTVWVNTYQMVYPSVPYGGVKQSGHGRNLGEASLDEFTQTKSVWMKVG